MTHPAHAEAWEWDEGNEAELAGHSIAPVEVEEVFANDPAWARNRKNRSGDWKMIGATDGGRRVTIIVRYDAERRLLRPITGWDATAGDQTRYFGKHTRGRP